jgi:DNA polymerase-3 subunit gamma/tau
MDKFIVSARKYRPQTFDTVVGQAHITTTLRNAILHNQLAHAFLFCGPRGVGKTTCARILAKTINCEKPTSTGEACNTCSSCVSFNNGASMNYFELDGASNNKVEEMHELINSVRVRPGSGTYKVYVIDEVHMLSSAAFNAFLKTLEEPPSYAIFILATTEKHKILPTILSRCQIFDFKRITLQDTVDHLQEICDKEEIKADTASLQVIAQKSEGCMRDSLSILDKIVSFTNGELNYTTTLEHLNILDADYYFRLLDHMQQQDLSSALLLFDEINRKGFEGDQVINGFAEFIRNLLVCANEKAAVLLEVVDSFRDKYLETARKTSPALLISALNILNDAEIGYKAARNKRLHVEMAIIRLCYLQQALQLTVSGEGLSKKKLSDGVKALPFRQLRPIGEPVKPEKKSSGAKLYVETAPEQKTSPSTLHPEPEHTTETPAPKPLKTGKLGGLSQIRQQFRSNGNNADEAVNLPLTQQALDAVWRQYIVLLKEGKNPAAQSFELATLRIDEPNAFSVISTNNLEQKFIEKERNKLILFLQRELKNKTLQYTVIIEERSENVVRIEPTLSARDQYLQLAELYPMVKELKERLRLELDY